MAERLSPSVASQLCATIDTSQVVTARDGVAARLPARIGFVVLDEGMDDDEAIAPSLRDRCAFLVDLQLGLDDDALAYDSDAVGAARLRFGDVLVDDGVVAALVGTALALGVWSLRAPLLAVRAARAVAALAGRPDVTMADAAIAARLVLAPRATRLPAAPEESEAEPPPETDQEPKPEPDQGEADAPDEGDREADSEGDQPIGDVVLEAAAAAIPANLLAQLKAGTGKTGPSRSQGKSGVLKASGKRGRPAGLRRAVPGPNARLNLVETLRAAAPWQRLRRTEDASGGRIQVRIDDFHVTRFKQRTETTTIFAVDASGSAASTRLAEAKGAVELLLADCYIRRDNVAVVAFRGTGAELLLAPTRSLVRAKRGLAGLPGGGGTPLAAGLDAAEDLAASVQRKGGTPVIVILTDGRANVGRDGQGGRAKAEAEALEAARRLKLAGRSVLFVDTSLRPSPVARALAEAMQARYLALPYVDAAVLSKAAQMVAPSR
jgi:magnesium chelatase subunit D